MIPVRIELKNDIEIPGERAIETYTSAPLTIITKSPRLRRIAGNDKITAKGLKTLLITEKMKPASKKPPIPAVT
jgi:hypothetical protein